MLGHFNKNKTSYYQVLKEFLVEKSELYKIGDKITVESFKVGQKVNISSKTIGKGNAGNIKRNNFSRGAMSHGSKHHRLQGSIGSGTTPGRVFPGKKMPGRLGYTNCTIKGVQILGIDTISNILILKGSIPGKSGNIIKITI